MPYSWIPYNIFYIFRAIHLFPHSLFFVLCLNCVSILTVFSFYVCLSLCPSVFAGMGPLSQSQLTKGDHSSLVLTQYRIGHCTGLGSNGKSKLSWNYFLLLESIIFFPMWLFHRECLIKELDNPQTVFVFSNRCDVRLPCAV